MGTNIQEKYLTFGLSSHYIILIVKPLSRGQPLLRYNCIELTGQTVS